MTDHTAEFVVQIRSPHGKAAIEEFKHYLNKVADESQARWGISIQIGELQDPDTEHSTEFN